MLEPADQRRQHIGDHQAGDERQQDALHQAEREDDEQEQADPEQEAIAARAHVAGSEPRNIRDQRTR